ncbi:26504_t:CDS:2, partial [Racocetra persica]
FYMNPNTIAISKKESVFFTFEEAYGSGYRQAFSAYEKQSSIMVKKRNTPLSE